MLNFDCLKNEVMSVLFYKKNGELREMKCTQNHDFIPSSSKSQHGYSHTTDQVRVWDVDKKAWRSFLKKNVILIETPKNEHNEDLMYLTNKYNELKEIAYNSSNSINITNSILSEMEDLLDEIEIAMVKK